MTMTITPPVKIGDLNLLESNIPENVEPAWDSSTSYVRGDKVTYNKSIYESVIAAGDTSQGDTPDAKEETPKWIRLGPSDRWAMFDGKIGTLSRGDYDFTWNGEEYKGIYAKVLPNEIFTSLTLFGINAVRIFLRVVDPVEGVLLDKEINGISSASVSNWFEYFFDPIELIRDLFEGDLPAFRTATVEIGLVDPGDGATLSSFLIGREIPLGCTRYGLRFGITDYSIKNTDEFGESDIKERGFSKRSNFELRIERGRVDFVQKTLARYRATPVVYRVLRQYESTLIYGFYKDFEIVLPGVNISRCNLDIEGLNEI